MGTIGVVLLVFFIIVCVLLVLLVAIQDDGENGMGVLGKLNTAISAVFAGVAIIFMALSIRNTEWILLEKGYYWMGLAFVAITLCSMVARASIISRLHSRIGEEMIMLLMRGSTA